MARTLAFDSTTVIKNARSLFWAKGFEAASIPDLEAATGLSRSSIYNSFGSKRGLFDAAVQSYLDEIVRPRLQPFMAEQVSATALTEYLDGLIAVFSQPEALPTCNGCLLINAASSPLSADSHVSQVVQEYREELEAAFSRGIHAGHPGLEPAVQQRLASTITGLIVASFALVRIAPAQASKLLEDAKTLVACQR
ncbi:TetR/AcrR family transcriptional regulator [Glutamicibacter sp. JL.03c]|uniref:TetR/AcrR family transcriptional regulator n=1 Tax=Glutamicibacter sp. JL.03c TaxID=2984842 RepID=UPI0021F6EBDC|nr:TetR/AcrR family transcriptional regulator [Glutamicibacter sp. JL.03c]UYQ78955.1 TetR/AcrR family transcriptional regulator [Glutamicibacter sp. JL.03c]